MGKSQTISGRLSSHSGRQIAALVSAGLLLGGCSLRPGEDAVALYQVAKVAFAPPASVTLEEAAAIPYASIGLRIGDSPQVLIILATDQNGEQLWTSSVRVSLVTRDGRIVRTGGFGHDLGELQGLKQSGQAGSVSVSWIADFPDLSLYGVPISCVQNFKGEEVITILGQKLQTRRIEEKCQAVSDQLDWSFTNTFWRDPSTGFTWKSVQHTNPKLDALEIEVLRPPV